MMFEWLEEEDGLTIQIWPEMDYNRRYMPRWAWKELKVRDYIETEID